MGRTIEYDIEYHFIEYEYEICPKMWVMMRIQAQRYCFPIETRAGAHQFTIVWLRAAGPTCYLHVSVVASGLSVRMGSLRCIRSLPCLFQETICWIF